MTEDNQQRQYPTTELTLPQISEIAAKGHLANLDDRALHDVARTVTEARAAADPSTAPEDPAILAARNAIWAERANRRTMTEERSQGEPGITDLGLNVSNPNLHKQIPAGTIGAGERQHGAMVLSDERLWFVPMSDDQHAPTVRGTPHEVTATGSPLKGALYGLGSLGEVKDYFRDRPAFGAFTFEPGSPATGAGPVTMVGSAWLTALSATEERLADKEIRAVAPIPPSQREHGAMMVEGERLWFVPFGEVSGVTKVTGEAREVTETAGPLRGSLHGMQSLDEAKAYFRDNPAFGAFNFRQQTHGKAGGSSELMSASWMASPDEVEQRLARVAIASEQGAAGRTPSMGVRAALAAGLGR